MLYDAFVFLDLPNRRIDFSSWKKKLVENVQAGPSGTSFLTLTNFLASVWSWRTKTLWIANPWQFKDTSISRWLLRNSLAASLSFPRGLEIFHLHPAMNKFFMVNAAQSFSELGFCVNVEVDVLDSPSLMVLNMVSADVMQHWTWKHSQPRRS